MFFVNPEMRRPLKHNILADLEKLKVLDHEKLDQALSWYTNDFRYMRKILTGADRIDLDGKKVGVVTFPEQEDERRRLHARKRQLLEKAEQQQRNNELSRRQAAMAAKVVLKPVDPPQRDGAAMDMKQLSTHDRDQALIELARRMQPVKVSALVTAARDEGLPLAPSSIMNQIYRLIHDGKIPRDRIRLGAGLGGTHENITAAATTPAEPPPKSVSTEHLRARIALFELALNGSPNKRVAKQAATDVAKMVVDEMSALVKAL